MSTIEARKTQLEVLETVYYKLQVRNSKLLKEKPEQAELEDLESELTQSKQENVVLVQQVDNLMQRVGTMSEDKETGKAELRLIKLRQMVEQLSGELEQLGEELSHWTE